MKLYLDVKTAVTDLTVDYIEVSLADGTTVSLNWDESYIYRDEPGFNAIYKGVRFNEEPADGRIDELQGMQIRDVGLCSETQAPATIHITKMEFRGGEKSILFEPAYSYTQEANEND